ncbi:MAG: TetR/AcrR family transcriptional regulator [Caulobacteraceae bacterium]|nr:TetR/AcrR family transcriptional regulator [Caulobacteraceae bacterium]
MNEDDAAPANARDTPKSLRTRARILDRALELFAEIGYAAATNAEIAVRAGLTRGAMLYHFPTREALTRAAAEHIQARRSALLAAADPETPPDADLAEHAIDVYWRLLQTPAFLAFAELEHAARTDPVVAAAIAGAQAEYDQNQAVHMLQAGAGPRFQASRDLARFMLEGLSRAKLTYDAPERTANLLMVIKRATHMLNRKRDLQDLWPEDQPGSVRVRGDGGG